MSDRVECGMASGLDWWCMLRPGHSGHCIPRRDVPDRAASAGPVRPGEEPTP